MAYPLTFAGMGQKWDEFRLLASMGLVSDSGGRVWFAWEWNGDGAAGKQVGRERGALDRRRESAAEHARERSRSIMMVAWSASRPDPKVPRTASVSVEARQTSPPVFGLGVRLVSVGELLGLLHQRGVEALDALGGVLIADRATFVASAADPGQALVRRAVP